MLAGVTHMGDVATRMAVWTVIGVIIAPLAVAKVVRMVPVNAGQETAHHVRTDMWVSTAI